METQENSISRSQYWMMVCLIYMSIGVMGLTELTSIVAYPLIVEYYQVDPDKFGLAVSCLTGAYLLGCFLASFILKYCGFKVLFASAYLVDIISIILIQFTRSFLTTTICLFIMGVSLGLYEISTNSTATALFKKNTATMMMLMQTCFGIGATLSPMVCKYGVTLFKRNYYSCYLGVGCIVTVFFVIAMFIKIPKAILSSQESTVDLEKKDILKDYTWKSTLTSSIAWICAFCMGCMEVVEGSANNWASLYLKEILHMDPLKEIPVFGTALQIIFTISRLISGPIIDKIGYYHSVYVSNIGCFIFLLIGFLTGKTGIYFFACTSFFYAWFWPTNICVFMGIFKEYSPLATSHIIVMQGILVIPLGYILGLINKYIGKQWAYRCSLVFCILGMIMTCIEYYMQKAREKKAQTQPLLETSVEISVEDENKTYVETSGENQN